LVSGVSEIDEIVGFHGVCSVWRESNCLLCRLELGVVPAVIRYPTVYEAEAVGGADYRVSGNVEDRALVDGHEIEAATSDFPHTRELRL
jgi:hypothetical protein